MNWRFIKIDKGILLHDLVPHAIITWSNKHELPYKSLYAYVCICITLDATCRKFYGSIINLHYIAIMIYNKHEFDYAYVINAQTFAHNT